MFGIDSTELIIVALAAVIFIGPKELPSALRALGRWIATIRAHARHFTGGVENMMREAEFAEMEAKWRRETPASGALAPPSPAATVPADVLPAEAARP